MGDLVTVFGIMKSSVRVHGSKASEAYRTLELL